MNIISKIFGKKKTEKPQWTNTDFWNWFIENERDFYNVVKHEGNIEKGFFDKLSPKLNALKDGYFFLAGMFDDNTAELIITPDGNVKNIVFTEDLIAAAPELERWKFTALKPELDIKDVSIKMAGFRTVSCILIR